MRVLSGIMVSRVPIVDILNAGGHRFKVRMGNFKGNMCGKFSFLRGGGCLEYTARGDGRSKYRCNINKIDKHMNG